MPVQGMGIELCAVETMGRDIESGGAAFLEKTFSPAEIAYCQSRPDPAQHFAARFAAKEACLKSAAWGPGAKFSLHDVEVTRGEDGPPRLQLHGPLKDQTAAMGEIRLHVSLTHTPELAAAIVIVERIG